MIRVVLGLGSNIERYHHIELALDALRNKFGALEISPVYEAVAVGFEAPPFLNLVVALQCSGSLQELAVFLRQLEMRHGRKADAVKFSSRRLDIDILSFGDYCGQFFEYERFEPELGLGAIALPRDEILYNAFVLRPLADLLPAVLHPLAGRSYADLWREWQLANRSPQSLRRVDFYWHSRVISRAEGHHRQRARCLSESVKI